MAFTFLVEDGTGLTASNSYLSISDLTDYWNGRGTDYSGEADADMQSALVQATQYIDTHYRFPGYKSASTQALEWPRTNAYDKNGYYLTGLPEKIADANIANATAEAAGRILEGTDITDLVPDLDRGGGIKREKVDVIEVEYFKGASPTKTFPHIDQILMGSGVAIGVVGGASSLKVSRV